MDFDFDELGQITCRKIVRRKSLNGIGQHTVNDEFHFLQNIYVETTILKAVAKTSDCNRKYEVWQFLPKQLR